MSFINDYLTMVKKTKPAEEYQIWSMISTLSAFAGRRFWFPFGPKRYYPNLYVILVGDPGNGKSTAMDRSLDVVREAKVCPISGTRITKEALLKRMSSDKFDGRKNFVWNGNLTEYNQYAIFATEFVDFLGMDAQGFLDFLTAAWDQSVIDNETKHQGQDLIVGPYITLLGCMTPEKLSGFMKTSILTGGFARRTAFMYSSKKNIIHWPSYSQDQKDAKARCIAFGQELQSKSGEFGMTEDCKRFYESWNQHNEETLLDRPRSTKGWYESKGEMLFKLSMLAALSESSELVIDTLHYRLALSWCEVLEKDLPRVFEGSGLNPNASATAQVCRMLEAMTVPMSRKKIEAMFFDQATSIHELRTSIDHLVAVGRLKERNVIVNGQLLGIVIGTPASMAEKTDVQLAVYLRGSAAAPVPETDTGSSSSVGPVETQP